MAAIKATIKQHGSRAGTRRCPDCSGEGGVWQAFVFFFCERCLGRGFVRL